jgi:transposase-like protein
MAPLSYRRHRFPAEIIQHAIWLYLRFLQAAECMRSMTEDRARELEKAMTFD